MTGVTRGGSRISICADAAAQPRRIGEVCERVGDAQEAHALELSQVAVVLPLAVRGLEDPDEAREQRRQADRLGGQKVLILALAPGGVISLQFNEHGPQAVL